MGKASSNKKIARIASTGGGRTARGRRPYGWYTVLTLLAAVGIFLVAFSRNEQQAAANVHPSAKAGDHWHDALAIDICGQIQPNLVQNSNLTNQSAPPGIHTHGDGLIHMEPSFSAASADAGRNATLARFVQTYPGFKLTSTQLQLPGQKLYKNGDKCNGKPAIVRIRMWPKAKETATLTFTDPKAVRLNDQGAITIAFLPASDDIPKPTTISALSNPSAMEPGNSKTPLSIPTPSSPAPATPGSTPAATPGSTPAASPGSTPASTPAATPGSTPASTPPASTGDTTPATTPPATGGATPSP